jgi:hypothetical protein
MVAKFAEGSTETEHYLGETITVWRTFEFQNDESRPRRRYHYDVSHRFFAHNFITRDEALASARWHISLEQYRRNKLGAEPPEELHAKPVTEKDDRAANLRERLELVTEENGYCPAEVEIARRKLGR